MPYDLLFINGSDGTLYAFASTFIETASIDPEGTAPLRTRLIGNRPNPFNPSTTIVFDVAPQGSARVPVTLKIYDTVGRLVETLIDLLADRVDEALVHLLQHLLESAA